jgi:signal transduction histidine kinase
MDPPPRDELEAPPDFRLVDVGHLSSAVCHYLINVFSAIVSSADMIQFSASSNGDKDEIQSHAGQIVNLALQASDVARGLIEFAQPRLPLGTEQIDLVELLRGVAQRNQARCSPALRWDDQLTPLPPITGEPHSLTAMFEAIVSNACEAVEPTGGTITFSCRKDARGRDVIEIRDDGPGMSGETRQRALEPFFSTKPDRLGVSLNLAKSIWTHHGGLIALHSDLGRGTSVRLHLPPSQTRGENQPSQS